MMHGDAVVTKLMSTTDSSEWEHVNSLDLPFDTDHPQGLLRVGDDKYFLSSVKFTKAETGSPDLSTQGQGFLTELQREGTHVGEAGARVVQQPAAAARRGAGVPPGRAGDRRQAHLRAR